MSSTHQPGSISAHGSEGILAPGIPLRLPRAFQLQGLLQLPPALPGAGTAPSAPRAPSAQRAAKGELRHLSLQGRCRTRDLGRGAFFHGTFRVSCASPARLLGSDSWENPKITPPAALATPNMFTARCTPSPAGLTHTDLLGYSGCPVPLLAALGSFSCMETGKKREEKGFKASEMGLVSDTEGRKQLLQQRIKWEAK